MTAPLRELAGRRLAVTGATGFVGSAFARGAVEGGAGLTVIARADSDRWRLVPVEGEYRLLLSTLDGLANAEPIDAEVFVHFASAGVDQTFDDVEELVHTNVVGTLRALQYALRSGVGRFVMLGSSGEYGPGHDVREDAPLQPTSEYGATRASATLLARSFGARRNLQVVTVRPFSVYGPYEAPYRLLPYAIMRALDGRPIEISSGVQTRDFIHVADVAHGIALAATVPGIEGEVFNLCTGVETTVHEAVELAARLAGGGSRVVGGARPAIPGEMWRTSGSPASARRRLGWIAAQPLGEGLAGTLDWFREVGRRLPVYAGDS